MKLLRIFLAGFLIANSALAWGQASRQVVTLDRIVAVVNDEVITRLELDSRLNFAARQLARQGTPSPPKNVLERQLLERLVNDRVQVQFARETGLRVDEAELDRAIQRIASDSKLTLDQLRQALERDGVPFQKFREDIRTEIVVARLREREVDNRITVTDGEIDNFIASQEARQGRRDEFDVSHILIRVPESASPEQINERRTRAEQALNQLRNGADFRQVAAAFSDAPDALSGGTMGWREENRLPTIFIDTVRSLRVGEVSEVLRSPNGFHLVRLNDKRGSQTPVIVQQTNARHILIRTNELVSESEARARLVGLKERLENKADFAALARANSEDSSAAKGGDLGWLSPGDTVPGVRARHEHAATGPD